MNTEKMYCLDKYCSICMNKSDLKHLFELDSEGVSHYNKLTTSIAEMNFKEMTDQRLICAECCITLNTVYDFRQMCLRSKANIISRLQTSDHSSGVCLKDIKHELMVVKNRGGNDKEGSNCLEESNPRSKLPTESYIENIAASVKQECESEDDDSSAHEDATIDHMNESTHSNVKVEDVEHQKMMEDYSEYYTKFYKIAIEEHPLEEVKQEPMSDTETPQDGSTSQAYTGTSEEPKGSEATTIGTELRQMIENDKELHQYDICQKSFSSMSDLTKHMVTPTNERPYKCNICEKSFKGNLSFSDHMRRHNGETPFQCEICNRGFIRKSALILHMLVHSNQKPFECEICKKGFSSKGNLNGHMKIHSNDRPYECEICKKGFKHKGKVIRHMKSHSSERPYECEICNKGFKRKDKLTRHIQTHSSERPYECEICTKGFKRKDKLTRHIKAHSNAIEKPFEWEMFKNLGPEAEPESKS